MDVNQAKCLHCRKPLHYSEAKLLPAGGVCPTCAQEKGYRQCEECQDYFIPESDQENFCEICTERIFVRFI